MHNGSDVDERQRKGGIMVLMHRGMKMRGQMHNGSDVDARQRKGRITVPMHQGMQMHAQMGSGGVEHGSGSSAKTDSYLHHRLLEDVIVIELPVRLLSVQKCVTTTDNSMISCPACTSALH